jgi:hypothetical protein
MTTAAMREGATLRLPPRSESPRRATLLEAVPAYLAVRIPGMLTARECAEYAARVVAARDEWTANFGGAQFTLGRAWYTHLEEDREEEYFEGAAASDERVRRWLPGLTERLLAVCRALLGGPVAQRVGWCGPGVHVFPARSEVARKGGEVHFDTEGLTDVQLARRARALTFVLMLQTPESGGGLRVWDRLYAGEDFPDEPGEDVARATVDYEAGELVVIDSYRLHQILPFGGATDRVSATVHVVLENERWEAWF